MSKKVNCPFNKFTRAIGKFFHNPKPYLKRFFFSFVWLAILMFIIDIVTKHVIMKNMSLNQEISLIPNFLTIHYVQNSGMAFGLDIKPGLTNTIFFIAISVIGAGVLIFITARYWKRIKSLPRAALMLMISGTIGNLIDRSFYINYAAAPVDGHYPHYVVDWIGVGNFARFNIADSCLTVGALILIVYLFVMEILEDARKRKAAKMPASDESIKKGVSLDETQIVDVQVEPVIEAKEEPKPVEKKKTTSTKKKTKTLNE